MQISFKAYQDLDGLYFLEILYLEMNKTRQRNKEKS